MTMNTDHILKLAEIIRAVDGGNRMGAAALAAAILSHPGSRWSPTVEPETEGLTDKELLGYMLKAAASVPGGQCTGILDWNKEAIAAARAVIAADRARWGRPATTQENSND
jgi:hypothetical protein